MEIGANVYATNFRIKARNSNASERESRQNRTPDLGGSYGYVDGFPVVASRSSRSRAAQRGWVGGSK
jgi:hypothetical protein